jgi:hypothetical protein
MPTFIRTASRLSHVGFNIPDNPDECWLFTGGHDTQGYGQAFNHLLNRIDKAHRVVWQWLNQTPIPHRPTKFHLHHRCENHGCVNPGHLELLTCKAHAALRSRAGYDKLRKPLTHGTLTAYVSHKCRCGPCRNSWNAYYRERRYQAKCVQALKDTLNRKPLGQ